MPDETDQIIQKRFAALPMDIRQAVTSPSLKEKLQSILTLHTISESQIIPLQNEVLLFMMGMVDGQEFVNNLSESLGMAKEDASLVAQDVYEELISPIEDSLIAFNQKELEVESKQPNTLNTKPEENPFLPPLKKNPEASNLQRIDQYAKPTTSSGMSIIDNRVSLLPPAPKIEIPPQTKPPEAPAPAPVSPAPSAPPIASAPSMIPPTPPTPSVSIKTPLVSSALAQEISNLMGSKMPSQTPATPQMPSKPEDKLQQMTQKPRMEVEMVKTPPTPPAKPSDGTDPYREPIA